MMLSAYFVGLSCGVGLTALVAVTVTVFSSIRECGMEE